MKMKRDHHYTPERKEQSKQWNVKGAPRGGDHRKSRE